LEKKSQTKTQQNGKKSGINQCNNGVCVPLTTARAELHPGFFKHLRQAVETG